MKNAFVFVALLAITPVHAASINYSCDCIDGNCTNQNISINGGSVQVTSTDKMNGMKFSATYDASYRPKGVPKIRFLGKEGENSRDVILSKEMLSRAQSGFMQIRGSEDGYWSADYSCSLK